MAPRATAKAKRVPELWNPKKGNNSTDDSQKEDDAMPAISLSRARKYTPGPDLAKSVRKEFFNLPPQKSTLNIKSPFVPGVASSHTPLSDDRGKCSV